MASAKKAESIKPGTPVRRGAKLLLTSAVATTFECLPAALAGEVETGIHDMRVAAKRLREQMRLFAPVYHRHEFIAAMERVDALNDTLGVVRDADVLLEHLALCGQASLVDAVGEAIAAERAASQQKLTAVLAGLKAEKFSPWLQQLIDVGRHDQHHAVAGQTCKRFARAEIGERVNKVAHRLATVTDEHDADGLHRVRVANKHLRYAIEPFIGLFDKRLAQAFRPVAELHGLLGDLHDLDVLAARLTKYATRVGRQTEADSLTAHLVPQRAERYLKLRPFLDGEQAGYLDAVAQTVA